MENRAVYIADVVQLAQYLVELTKLGAAYQVKDYGDGFMVTITGF
jgi:hypothetical protein